MTGEYVAFLDSDDIFYPEMIQIMITEIKKNLGELKNMNFDDVLKGLGNSLNFKVMVCYKLFFSRDGFIKNIGSI